MRQPLLLFDIDGTLLDSGGAGLGALQAGLIEAFGLQDRADSMPELDLAGATDASVARELFAAFEIRDTAEHRARFYEAYVSRLDAALAARRHEARLLPGVQQLLDAISAEGSHLLGLLTGNIEAGARAKLRHLEIDAFFAFGAFGDDAEHRDQLGPIALERARTHAAGPVEVEAAIIIGDTPRDVACARAAGMKCLAVATGNFNLAQLRGSAPDRLLADLSDLGAVFSAITELSQSPLAVAGPG